jgi:hypothetical protein
VVAGRTGELGEVRSLGILPMWRAASRPVAGGITDHWRGSSGACRRAMIEEAGRSPQLVQKPLCVLQIRRAETFSEPAVDRREQVAGFGGTSSNARCPRDPSAKRQSTAKSYEPFPLANMAPNSPSASPLIPSVK